MTQLKVNRKVDLDRRSYRDVGELGIAHGGMIVHPQGFGSIRVFKLVSRDGDIRVAAQ